MTSCPKCKGGPFPIATGAPDFVSNGRPAIPANLIGAPDLESTGATPAVEYGKRFFVTNSDSGEPLANRKFIAVVSGSEREGTTDGDGYANVDAKPGESIELHLIFDAPKGLLVHQGR